MTSDVYYRICRFEIGSWWADGERQFKDYDEAVAECNMRSIDNVPRRIDRVEINVKSVYFSNAKYLPKGAK